ncbi:hypothetical protein FRB95_003002 [Tulasnella sp. JGI-2019a]|nr:hypothetical protein FRB95_003002 [Tulasnella sp. JGI-2019a]
MALILSALVLWLSVTTKAQIPPWEAQTFDFGWSPYNSTLTQCRILNIQWGPRNGSNPMPTAPYQLLIYKEGMSPLTYAAGAGPTLQWQVNLPTGGPYLMSMGDSAGGTGGVGTSFNVLSNPAGVTCTSSGLTQGTLNFTLGAVTNQCNTIPITAADGTPPFTLTVLPQEYPPKHVIYDSGSFDYVLDLPAGVNTYISLQDSTGRGGVAPFFAVGASSNSSCLKVAATLAPGVPALTSVYPGFPTPTSVPSSDSKGKSSLGPIIGGIVAGVLLLIAIIALLIWWFKRRQARQKLTTDLTPTRGSSEVGHWSHQNLAADPYTTPPHTADAQTTEFGGRSVISPLGSYQINGSYQSTKQEDRRGSFGSSTAGFTSNVSDPMSMSSRPTSFQPSANHHPNAAWDPYGAHAQQMVALQQERRASGSPINPAFLPPGAAAPRGNQMQSFGGLAWRTDLKGPRASFQQQQQQQGRPGSSTGSAGDREDGSSVMLTTTAAGTSSSPSPPPPPSKGGVYDSRTRLASPGPPPLYTEQLSTPGR